jgi:ribose transport system ATP-binding protein
MGNNLPLTRNKCLLEMRDIRKTFPGVKALDGVYLNVYAGEVLAIMGENGAGKSTLSKILCGVYRKDTNDGEIIYQGKVVDFKTPMEAKQAGIVMIFQELSLVMDLSVGENIYLGTLPKKRRLIDWGKLNNDAKKVLEELDCNIDPMAIIRTLPIAQQQMVEIGRAVALNAKIVIFDEPTSALTDKEVAILFKNIRRLKEQGVGIIYISHKMNEIKQITDRIVVLRDGKTSGEFITKQTEINDIINSMIGRQLTDYYHKSVAMPGEEVLRVEKLSDGKFFNDINMCVRRCEVVGLSGLMGAGRTEIMEAIFGLRKIVGGKIFFEKKEVKILAPRDSLKYGIALVPEDRKTQGLALRMSLQENMQLAKLQEYTNRFGLVMTNKSRQMFELYREKLSIACTGPDQEAVYLSGGNQQKVVLGKWLSVNPKLLILDEPTKGIDVGSKAQIHKLISDLADNGLAVIVISSEMPEIIGVCNRVYTIANGKLTMELIGDQITEKNLIQGISFS